MSLNENNGSVGAARQVLSYGGTGLSASVRRVLVLGASRSGCSAALALLGQGREVVISDRKDPDTLPGLAPVLAGGARFVREASLIAEWPVPDLVIKSPGVPAQAPPVAMARSQGVPVWGELELAYVLLPNPFDCVTGTNGKTTTTALLGHLLTSAGIAARVVGNIGIPVTSLSDQVTAEEELVTEVSSFQLEDTVTFRPAVGVLLNVTPDHLDRHGSMERYLACKAKLFANQGPDDVAVMNATDPIVRELAGELARRDRGPQVRLFSTSAVPEASPGVVSPSVTKKAPMVAWLSGGWIYLEGERLIPASDIRLPGRHNLENCLAAAVAAAARGAGRTQIAEGLSSFLGVPHRLETVGVVRGVVFVNDSKATNVDATLTALAAYPERTHLILGGRDKASDYRPVARACASGCKGVYLIGEAAPLIAEAFAEVREKEGGKDIPEVRMCEDLEKALRTATEKARSGDVVLLAPACASFDQYENYEARGEHFRALVRRLAEEEQL